MYHPNKYLASWNIFLLISSISIVFFPPVKVALPFKGQIFLAFDFDILYSNENPMCINMYLYIIISHNVFCCLLGNCF